jgi:hypothetical protein
MINKDPNGAEYYVDSYGYVDYNRKVKDKDDMTVYQIGTNKEGNEILTIIGKIGETVDISYILNNIIDRNTKISKNLNIFGYFDKVKENGVWDLKSNKNTIFGLAWSLTGEETSFSTAKLFFDDASDVGNYHAGFMGVKAGIPVPLLWYGAGTAETIKDIIHMDFWNALNQANKMKRFSPPFGDENDDFLWNTKGMSDAKRK